MDKKMLNNLIEKMPKKNLIELIELMTQFNSEAEQTLLDYCQIHALPENKNVIVEKQLQKHWGKAYQIIDFANTYGGCSEEDEETVYDEIESVLKLIKENTVLWACRKEIVDEMLTYIETDNSGFTDLLVDSAMEICNADAEQEYFADHLAKMGSHYYKGYAATILRELGKADKFLKIQKSNLVYGSDYLTLSDYCEECGQKEQAIKIAWEGLDKCQGRLDELYRYLFSKYENDEQTLWKLYEIAKKKKQNLETMIELMHDYFVKVNQYENQKNMLIEMVQCCNPDAIGKWYKKCKMEMQLKDWTENEPEILKNVKEKNLSEYLRICLANDNTKEVLEYLKKERALVEWRHLDENHRFSMQLSKIYPDEITELYWREVKANLDLKKEKGYWKGASVLKEIRTIMQDSKQVDDWNRKYAELLMTHKKKRLLIKILEETML